MNLFRRNVAAAMWLRQFGCLNGSSGLATIGCLLLESARSKKNWWSNRDSPNALQALAWFSKGDLVLTGLQDQQKAQIEINQPGQSLWLNLS